MLSDSAWTHIRRNRGLFLGLGTALIVWCAVDVYRRGIVDPAQPWLHMTDFTVYTEAGAAFFDGREPYDVSNVRGWKYLYPPLFGLLVAPLHALAPEWQVSVWFVLCAGMCFGCYFECRRLVARLIETDAIPQSRVPPWLFGTALLAVLFPALNCLQRGQMGITLIYPLLLGFRLIVLGTTPRAWLGGGLVLALPVAFKLTPALPVACLLLVLLAAAVRRRRRPLPALWTGSAGAAPACDIGLPQVLWSTSGALAGTAMFFLLLPSLLIGWNANGRALQIWHTRVVSKVNDVKSSDFGGDVASVRNQSLSNAVYRGGNWVAHCVANGPDDRQVDTTEHALGSMPMDAPAVERCLLLMRIAALLALAAVGWRAAGRGDLLSIGSLFGLACVGTLVFSPIARGHYFVFLLPAALFVPLHVTPPGSSERRGLVFALVPAFLSVLHYVALDYAGRVGALGIGIALWYFAACGVLFWKTPSLAAVATTAVPGPAEVRRRKAG